MKLSGVIDMVESKLSSVNDTAELKLSNIIGTSESAKAPLDSILETFKGSHFI